jgi:hypothetical protein
MDLNFPVFATGVCIIRASNDVGTLFLGPGSTRILEINKMDAVMFFVDFPFLKNDPLKLNIVEKPNVHRLY